MIAETALRRGPVRDRRPARTTATTGRRSTCATFPDEALEVFCRRAHDMVVAVAVAAPPVPVGRSRRPEAPTTGRCPTGDAPGWCIRSASGRTRATTSGRSHGREARARRHQALRRSDAVYLNFIGDEGEDRVIAGFGRENYDRLAGGQGRVRPRQRLPPAPQHQAAPDRLSDRAPAGRRTASLPRASSQPTRRVPTSCSSSRPQSSAPARWAARSPRRSPPPTSPSCSRTSTRSSSTHGLEKAREVTKGQLDRLVKKEKLTQEQADARLEEVMGLIEGTTSLRRLRRRRLRDRGRAGEDGDQAGGLRRARRGHARATRSSPPTPPRSRSPRWARRRCGPRRSSASTSSTRPR